MSESLPAAYEPGAIEAHIYQMWLDRNAFHAEATDAGEPYCIVIPPPNVTGALHLGHAIDNTLQDILIRVHRMRGCNAVWIPGIDHAGIATQAVVEKQLREQENLSRHEVGREGLVQRIWKWKEQYGERILHQLKRMGASCDWARLRFTLDEQCARAVRATFFKLFKDGLISRGKRLVNWDVFLQTSISDDEIYHENVKTSLWHIRYPIDGTSEFMTVATTRPETMLGDTAVAVHSEDARWNRYIGQQVRLPLTDRLIPIIADDILVDPKFGTGVVKVTPAHDFNDYAVYQRHLGKADEIALLNILRPDGHLNEAAGAVYAGQRRDHARKQIVIDLAALGLLIKEEPHEAEVGHSDRSKTPVEPYLSDQWFVRMAPLAEPALDVVRRESIRFFPERHAQQYLAWLGEKRDWPVSRQLWWGHRIPVWHHAAPSTESLEWLQLNPEFIAFNQNESGIFVCARDSDPLIEQRLVDWGYLQDPDVLDTWFSSALWPHSTLGWPEQTGALQKWYPTRVLVTGRDIITLWVARMVMTGLYNLGQIPFDHVCVHPTILDGKGERMSKSKGNGVDPLDIIETHGADALRFTMSHMATETQDVRLPVKKLPSGKNSSVRFDLGRNFCNKLWNAARFVFANLQSAPGELSEPGQWATADRWIVSRFNRTVADANTALATYRFDAYARACYDFFWRDLCDWYVEASKPALKDPARATQTADVLAAVLDGTLRLLHPIIPFITERLWSHLNQIRPTRGLPIDLACPPSELLIKANWPIAGPLDESTEQRFSQVQEIVGIIRNARNDYKIDPRKAITLSISGPAAMVDSLAADRQTIELLATCAVSDISSDLVPPPNAIRATAAGCEIYLMELIDPAAEKQRLAKRCEELRKTIHSLRGRLGNESYMSKAPPQLVQQTHDQLTEAEAEFQKLDGSNGG